MNSILKRCFISVLVILFVSQFSSAQEITEKNNGLSPEPRRGHLAVYDPVKSLVLVLGGHGRENVTDQEILWSWNSHEWKNENEQGPPPRTLTAGGYDRTNSALVIHGGIDPRNLGRLGNTWLWNGAKWTIADNKKDLSYLDHHAAAYDIARNKLVVFGGQFEDRSFSTSTWEWDGNPWTERVVPGPDARGYHAMAYDSQKNLILLYGGVNEEGNRLGDMWSWNGKVWQEINQGPGKRSHHRMTYDSERNHLVLYGGNTDDPEGEDVSVLADTWIWNGSEVANDDSVWEWNGEKWIRINRK